MSCVPPATALSIYQSVQITKRPCPFHPNLQNCYLIRTKTPSGTIYEHFTRMDVKYCSIDATPYYQWLLTHETEVQRTNLLFNSMIMGGVKFWSVDRESLRSVEEGGERDVGQIRLVMKHLHGYLSNDKGDLNGHSRSDAVSEESKVYVLMNRMYVQCVYSFRQCIVLPQEMYCLYKEGNQPEINRIFRFTSVPESEGGVASQHIYKTFLIYNTILTMMLRESNPFNDTTKVISKIIESVGTCNGGEAGGKRNRIKVCELNFGGEPPGHVMCPPKEMIKKIFRYAKWRLNPKIYSRYYAILVNDDAKTQEYIREWSIFVVGFQRYFFPSEAE
ncbi:VP1054 [Plodia interpunctella granulovirus]|uniref:VP1054 n=1 Tax=Plodia interpunctella granulovirus TaxID=262175 RepID=A0A1L5JGU7_9BBAC|nr:VP1054 [Plodia interpunctella granulovirus]APO14005.1 VP1054 [Plodia interpunctella granulovirus]